MLKNFSVTYNPTVKEHGLNFSVQRHGEHLTAKLFGKLNTDESNAMKDKILSTQQIVDLAISFLRISLCGLPFLLTIYLTGAFMRCIEKPGHVFYPVGLTSLANIILDALFIIVFGWSMKGAALATVHNLNVRISAAERLRHGHSIADKQIVRGSQETTLNFVISLLPLIVQVPLIWFLPIEFIALAYSAQDVAEASVAFLLIQLFFREKRLSLRKIFALRR